MKKVLLLFLLLVSLSGYAQGTSEAIVDYVPTGNSSFIGTLGFTFTNLANVTVYELGVFDYLFSDTTAINVGLWTSGGVPLALKTVYSTNNLVYKTRYVAVDTPISLVAAQVYHIGAYKTNGMFADYTDSLDQQNPQTPNFLPYFTLGHMAQGTNGFAFPQADPFGQGAAFMTANFRIPEPSIPAFLTLAGGFALLLRRRRS